MASKVLAYGGLALSILSAGRQTIAQPPEHALPAAASGILVQMDKEIVSSKTKAITALDKVMKDTTKKGDLAGAVAVKETMEQLKREIQAGARQPSGRARPNSFIGRWTDGKQVCEIFDDGTSRHSNGAAGSWQAEGQSIELKWSNGYVFKLKASPDGLVGVIVDQAGRESDCKLMREK